MATSDRDWLSAAWEKMYGALYTLLSPHKDEDDDFATSIALSEMALNQLDVHRISDPKVKAWIETIEEYIGMLRNPRRLTFEEKWKYGRAVREFYHWLDKEFHWRDEHRNWDG